MKKLFNTGLIILLILPGLLLTNQIIEIKKNPALGFNFPYILFIPETVNNKISNFLMVEPNNTGSVNDDLKIHYQAVIQRMERKFTGRLAYKLGVPFLRPVFPRPKSDWRMYTHALDRDTIRKEKGPLKRLDLQLLAMVRNCRTVLKNRGFNLKKKILLNGFSASGTFVNRFVFLHPKVVKAVAAGGLNGILILPFKHIDQQVLNFPLGIADYQKITERVFQIDLIKQVRQFLYMGELDKNDASLYDDGYDDDEKELVHNKMGKVMMPDRWEFCQRIYQQFNLDAIFNTYKDVGHGTDLKINNELFNFFKSIIKEG